MSIYYYYYRNVIGINSLHVNSRPCIYGHDVNQQVRPMESYGLCLSKWYWQFNTNFVISLSLSVPAQWKGLVNGVSGLICASLSSIDSSLTYQPPSSFRPEGALLGEFCSCC